MRNALAVLCALAFLSCGGGGGRGGPTDPVQYPSVAGAWVGSWTPLTSPITVRLNLVQGVNGDFTGTMTALSTTLDITGNASPGLAITWRNVQTPTGCGTLTGSGQLNSLAASSFSGSIDLDSRGCASGTRFVGPVTFTRGSLAPADGLAGTPEDLDRVLRELAR